MSSVRCVKRVMPLAARMRPTSSGVIVASMLFRGGAVQEHAAARPAYGPHGLPAFDLAHIDGHILVDDREVRGLAALLHETVEKRARGPRYVSPCRKALPTMKASTPMSHLAPCASN